LIAFVVPGSLETKTGGTIYDKKIVAGLRARGWDVDVIAPDALSTIADGTAVVIDGLASKTHAELIEHHADRLRPIALVHLPLALEIGIADADAVRLRAIERRVLARMRHIVVTGPTTVRMLEGYDVPRDRVTVVEPGVDPAPIARGSGASTVRLLCVASVTAGKGQAILLRALKHVSSQNWTLTCAGRIVTAIENDDRRVTFAGELDEARLRDAYDRADVFVLATLRETFGMAVAEAIAHGLPVVSTKTGSIPATVGEGGIVIDPGDERALSSALERVIGDAGVRARLKASAIARRSSLRSWDAAIDAMVRVIELVAHD